MRRWLLRLALALALVGCGLAVAGAWWVGPYLRDALVLDRVVRAVALDWRDFGREQAVLRLQHELDAQGIGPHVRDEDCHLEEEEASRRVRCAWSVELEIPGLDRRLPLAFASEAVVGPDGALR